MHLIKKIRQILQETTSVEIWLSQMSMNTFLCEAEFMGVTHKYLVIKVLGVEFLIEPGVEKEFKEQQEKAYFRIQTIQDVYQWTGDETETILL